MNKIDSLTCRMCNKKYKSGLGLLSHVESCGLDKEELMIECDYCKKPINKVYMNSHLRSCHVLFEMQLKEKLEAASVEKLGKNVIVSNSGRIKRASMIKAEGYIKSVDNYFDPDIFIKFPTLPRKGVFNKWKRDVRQKSLIKCYFQNCTFTSTNVADMKQHVSCCNAISSLQLKCSKCDFSHEVIDILREHITANHKNEAPPDNDSDASIKSGESDDEVSSGVDETEDLTEEKNNKSKTTIKHTPMKEKQATPGAKERAPAKPVENKYRKRKF